MKLQLRERLEKYCKSLIMIITIDDDYHHEILLRSLIFVHEK